MKKLNSALATIVVLAVAQTGLALAQIAQSSGLSGSRERLLMDAGWRFAFGNATDPTNTLVFGGQISGGTTLTSTLTLGGTNTGANSINGNVFATDGSSIESVNVLTGIPSASVAIQLPLSSKSLTVKQAAGMTGRSVS